MINLSGMISLLYLKRSAFTGSYEGMRYRLKKEDDQLQATVWPEPFSFDFTPDEKKVSCNFTMDQAGLEAAIGWLNEAYEAKTYL